MLGWIRKRARTSRRFVGLHEARPLIQSFNFAFEGVIHTLATQRNMRIHFAVAAMAMLASVGFGVTRVEFALILFAATFVIAAEMLNTAIEAAIDVATTSFNPLAKVAKDVAAGAVLIATFNAIAVGYLVFAPLVGDPSRRALLAVRDAPVHITFVALVLTLLSVVALKVVSGRDGTPLRGGWPSGHAAIAFAAWMAIAFVTAGTAYGTLVAALTFVLALLVCHTRVEAGVHTPGEVLAGAVVGSSITLLVFQLFELLR
ncbi:MAG: diacylglycerol kinase [Thermoleophilia bacterium]|nr:diacylglycerol kinase [Thermoleophilia bacterium]